MHGNSKLPKNLGKKIQKRRKAMKLTQERLAEKAGISLVYMGYIEQGKYAPSLEVLERLAKALDISIKELF